MVSTRVTKSAPTGAAHKNRCARAQAAKAQDAESAKARHALQNPPGSWKTRKPGEVSKFGKRNAALCRARLLARSSGDPSAIKALIQEAHAIAPLTSKEQRQIDEA